VKSNLQNFSYAQILEPTKDLAVGHSIITSWSLDAFKFPYSIGSVKVTCSRMINFQQVHEHIILHKFGQAQHVPSQHNKFGQQNFSPLVVTFPLGTPQCAVLASKDYHTVLFLC